MSRDEIVALAVAYIEHYSRPYFWDENMVLMPRDTSATAWASQSLFDLSIDDPETAWSVILEVLSRNPPKDVLEVLAAGPLEQYLAEGGDKVIARVEQQAAKDARFRNLLGGVWQNAMSDEVWARVQACCDRSGWTF